MSGYKRSKIRHTISLLATGVGLVLLWRGIWDLSDQYLSVYTSLVLGVIILVVIALLEKRQVFKFFGEE
jgi:hypothetical protein